MITEIVYSFSPLLLIPAGIAALILMKKKPIAPTGGSTGSSDPVDIYDANARANGTNTTHTWLQHYIDMYCNNYIKVPNIKVGGAHGVLPNLKTAQAYIYSNAAAQLTIDSKGTIPISHDPISSYTFAAIPYDNSASDGLGRDSKSSLGGVFDIAMKVVPYAVALL